MGITLRNGVDEMGIKKKKTVDEMGIDEMESYPCTI